MKSKAPIPDLETLKSAHKVLVDINNTIPAAIIRYTILTDGTDRIEYYSDGCEKVWGYSASDLNGDPSALWALTLHQDVAKIRASIEKSMETLCNWEHEWRITPHGSDRIKWLRGYGKPSRNADGSTTWTSLILDVTSESDARRQVEVASVIIQQRNEKIEKLLEESSARVTRKNRLIANLSHELRTPLNALLGYSEVLATGILGPLENPKHAEYATITHHAAQHLSSLVDRLLEYSRSHLAAETADFSKLNLTELVQEAVQFTVANTSEKFCNIENQVSGPFWVSGDAVSLRQCAINLLTNAAKYGPEWGNVFITAERVADNETLVRVRDEGNGFKQKDTAKMLEPLIRDQHTSGETASDRTDGLGLGLAIVSDILHAHGGRLEFEWHEPTGFSAKMYIPTFIEQKQE